MRYELKENSNIGILVDRTPIIGDVKGEKFEVQIDYDKKYANLVADITSTDGYFETVKIKNGTLEIPRNAIKRGKEVFTLTVYEIGTEKTILHTWKCAPFMIKSLCFTKQSLVELICGLTDEDWLKLLQEVKQENETILSTLASLNKSIEEYKSEVATLKYDCANIARAHNALVEEFNKHKEEI